jgi:tetratricopeptide (TPR) repeat protein
VDLRSQDLPDRSARAEVFEALIRSLSSDYLGALCVAQAGRERASRQHDSTNYETSERIVRTNLLLSGQWHRFLDECSAASERHEKNGTGIWLAFLQLQLAQLHAECFAFEQTLKFCEDAVRNAPLSPFYEYFVMAVRATAEAGAGLDERAMQTVGDVLEHQDTQMLLRCRWMLLLAKGEALLLRPGCLDEASQHAKRTTAFAMSTDERSWKAISLNLAARVHLARNEYDDAVRSIEAALELIDSRDAPSFAWRVLATASSVYQGTNQNDRANRCRAEATLIIKRLQGELRTSPDLAARFGEGATALVRGTASQQRTCQREVCLGAKHFIA